MVKLGRDTLNNAPLFSFYPALFGVAMIGNAESKPARIGWGVATVFLVIGGIIFWIPVTILSALGAGCIMLTGR